MSILMLLMDCPFLINIPSVILPDVYLGPYMRKISWKPFTILVLFRDLLHKIIIQD